MNKIKIYANHGVKGYEDRIFWTIIPFDEEGLASSIEEIECELPEGYVLDTQMTDDLLIIDEKSLYCNLLCEALVLSTLPDEDPYLYFEYGSKWNYDVRKLPLKVVSRKSFNIVYA